MTAIVPFPLATIRRYQVLIIEDDTLAKLGVRRGEEFVVAENEFFPGDYHAVDVKGFVKVLRMCERPPNLIGRVLPPPFKEPLTLDPVPADGIMFNTDAVGNIVELDGAVIERCWGVPAKSCLGYGFIQQIAPERRANFMTVWTHAINCGSVCNLRTVSERNDGSRVNLVVTAVPHKNGLSERFRGWTGVTQPGALTQVA